MTRTRAALIHLTISALVVGTVLTIVFFVWYPDYLFSLSGAIDPVLVMIGVDVTLGPLLTFIVFKPGKPGLKFDLAVIFAVQIVALLYGSITLFNQRPHFLVFANDSFAALSARAVDMSALRYEEFTRKPLIGPVKVFAELPQDEEERREFVEGVLFRDEPDIERRPEFYEPYKNGASRIREHAIPIEDFEPASDVEAAELARARARLGEKFERLALVPTLSLVDDFALVIDLDSLEPLMAIRVNAWQETEDPEVTETL